MAAGERSQEVERVVDAYIGCVSNNAFRLFNHDSAVECLLELLIDNCTFPQGPFLQQAQTS